MSERRSRGKFHQFGLLGYYDRRGEEMPDMIRVDETGAVYKVLIFGICVRVPKQCWNGH